MVTHADFCRPFHAEGALVEVVRAQLAALAERLGWRLKEQGLRDLHLEVDGRRVDPQLDGLAARFAVPAAARDVWLVSPTSIPSTLSASPDTRQLGACLRGFHIEHGQGAARAVAVDDPRLCVGFHATEGDDTGKWRWTAGRARLPVSLWSGTIGDCLLRVDFAGPMLPRWVAPVTAARAHERPALAG